MKKAIKTTLLTIILLTAIFLVSNLYKVFVSNSGFDIDWPFSVFCGILSIAFIALMYLLIYNLID